MANRFMQPVATPVDMEFFSPNVQLWASILQNQQKYYDEGQQVLAKRPEYDARIDQSAFGDYLSKIKNLTQSVASDYSSKGVLAGNRSMGSAMLNIQQDWSPGGDAYQLLLRKQMIQAEKERLQEVYKDFPMEANYAIDKLYRQGVEPFRLQNGNFGSVLGVRTPTPFTAKERIDLENSIISEINDVIGASNPQVRKLLQSGQFTSLVQVMSVLPLIERERAMSIIENRMPKELIDFAVFSNEARGQFLPQGADPYSFRVRDANGKVIGYNGNNPLLGDFLGLAESARKEEAKIDIRTITDEAGLELYKYNLNNASYAIVLPGMSQNGQSNGTFGEGANSSNISSKVVAAQTAYAQEASAFAARHNATGTDFLTNALSLTPEEFNQRFPGENRARLSNLFTHAAEMETEYKQLQEIGEAAVAKALGPEKYQQYLNEEARMRGEMSWLIENEPSLQGFTVDQLMAMEQRKTSTSPTGGGALFPGAVAGNKAVIGGQEYTITPALQRVFDAKRRSQTQWREAEELKQTTIDNRLSENVSHQSDIVSHPTVYNLDGTQNVSATNAVKKQLDSYYANPQTLLNATITDQNGNQVLVMDVVKDMIASQTGRDINSIEAELKSVKVNGFEMSPNRYGDQQIQISYINDKNVRVPLFIPQPSVVTELVNYGDTKDNLMNSAAMNSDPQKRNASAIRLSQGDANVTMGNLMARSAYYAGSSFVQTDVNGNPVFLVEIADQNKGASWMSVKTADGNIMTDKRIILYPILDGQPLMNTPITDESKAKTFLENMRQVEYKTQFNLQ